MFSCEKELLAAAVVSHSAVGAEPRGKLHEGLVHALPALDILPLHPIASLTALQVCDPSALAPHFTSLSKIRQRKN